MLRSGRRPAPLLLALLAAFAATLALGIAAAEAGASRAENLGKTDRTPRASCPKSPCQAVGSVTGIQLTADGRKQPFRARRDGKVVAWSIQLSRPNKEQRKFFGDFYSSGVLGTKPSARISVVKKVDGRKYKLTGQSPVVQLASSYASRQTFTLTNPLRIRKGEFLALTVPTWTPSFAVGLSGRENVWRASRKPGKCSGEGNIKSGKPMHKVGKSRTFGCDYRTARLLYWGYYVPKKG